MKLHKLSLKVVSKSNEPRTVKTVLKKNEEEKMPYKTKLCNIRRDKLIYIFFQWRSRCKHMQPLINSLRHATNHKEKINKHRSNIFKSRPRD